MPFFDNLGMALGAIIQLVVTIFTDYYFSGSRSIKPEMNKRYFIYLINGVIIAIILSGISVGSFITWCSTNAVAFFIIGIFFETIPITGGFIDLLFTVEDIKSVKQYQGFEIEGLIGTALKKKRFDISWESIKANIYCNILAFLCSFWLIITIGSLSHFDSFFESVYWIDILSITGSLSLLICLLQAQGMQQNKITGHGFTRSDYSLLDRYNTFLNLVAIWVNMTLITTSIMMLFIYCMKNFGNVSIPLTTGVSLLSVELFLDLGCGSRYGLRNRKVNSRALKVGWGCILVLVAIIVFSSNVLSTNTLAFVALSTYTLIRWKRMEKRVYRFESRGEHNETQWILFYPQITFIVMGVAVLVQLFYKTSGINEFIRTMRLEYAFILVMVFTIYKYWY